jgi:hypothetical protein
MSRKKIDIGQLDIFSLIEELSRKQAEVVTSPAIQGKASIDAAVRSLISDALKKSPLSRYEIAARMSDLLGVEITKAQIDAWSAESKEHHRFPLVYIGAFADATINKSLARYVAQLCGGHFIEGEDAVRLELGRIEEQKAELQRKEQAIRAFLDTQKKPGGK